MFERFKKNAATGASMQATELCNSYMRMMNPLEGKFSEVRYALACAAVPESVGTGRQPHWQPRLDRDAVRATICQYDNGEIDANKLSEIVFGRDAATLEQQRLDQERRSSLHTSTHVLDVLADTPASKKWKTKVGSGKPTPQVMEYLGELTNAGAPTVADLLWDSWRSKDPYRFLFQNAGRAGFVTVAWPFGAVKAGFADESRDLLKPLVNADGGPRSIHPFEVLPNKVAAALRVELDRLAHELRDMYGRNVADKPGEYSNSTDKHVEALHHAARIGASLAAVLIDPSECVIYDDSGERMQASALPWRTDNVC